MAIQVEIHTDEGVRFAPSSLLKRVVRRIAEDYHWHDGQISIAIVSDKTIHGVNRKYLNHDYPTDVISFDLTDNDELLEGEIIASVETADRVGPEHQSSGDAELLLYVIHGMLHIIGLNDKEPDEIRLMRETEAFYVDQFASGLGPKDHPTVRTQSEAKKAGP